MQNIPLNAVPSQTLNVVLDSQPCTLNVYSKFYGVYVDVYVNGALVVAGVRGENLNRIVRSVYLGFSGDLTFADAQGNEDPEYSGFGARYFLVYLTTADLAELGLVG